jgi:hypothetical protein
VIDDFHRLPEDIRERLANIAKRTGIHKISPGTAENIAVLVNAGCEKLNVQFSDANLIFEESRGDYWLTQRLCQTACAAVGLTDTSEDTMHINLDVSALREKVAAKLLPAYYPAVKEFCRGRRFRPSNDPYYKLLKTVGSQNSSVVDLNELANAIPDVRGSINNIKEHRLKVLLESKELCGKYFYYNNETRNFAIEDPALFYFIRHLDWTQLRTDCGFREVEHDRQWDVAISFAGENRELAKHIVNELTTLDVGVFFDEHYENNFLGTP